MGAEGRKGDMMEQQVLTNTGTSSSVTNNDDCHHLLTVILVLLVLLALLLRLLLRLSLARETTCERVDAGGLIASVAKHGDAVSNVHLHTASGVK